MSCKEAKKLLGGSTKCYSSKSTVAKEMHSTFNLKLSRAKHSFCKIHFDGCVYTGNEKRCDFIFTINNSQEKIVEWVFVELKGQAVADGIKQLTSTINQLGPQNLSNIKVSTFIISTEVPTAAKFKIRAEMEAFRRKFKRLNPSIVVKNNKLEYIVR